jgi:hypothetical protein
MDNDSPEDRMAREILSLRAKAKEFEEDRQRLIVLRQRESQLRVDAEERSRKDSSLSYQRGINDEVQRQRKVREQHNLERLQNILERQENSNASIKDVFERTRNLNDSISDLSERYQRISERETILREATILKGETEELNRRSSALKGMRRGYFQREEAKKLKQLSADIEKRSVILRTRITNSE